MPSSPPVLALSASRSLGELLADYASLTKPRLSGLVLFTTFGGMWLAGPSLGPWTWLCALVGTAGTVAAANAFNCYLERDSDRHMARTASRPLPTGRLQPGAALAFALALTAASVPLLALGTNALTGAIGLVALLSYVLVYTPLKAKTPWAMVVGAVPGALPPLMGWTAATGRVEAPGVVLFAILFFWQLPHFLAIALFRKDEYRAAGLQSVPLAYGDAAAWRQAVLTLVPLVPLSLALSSAGVTGALFAAAATALGAAFAAVAVLGLRVRDVRWARRLFFASLLYLTGLFGALGLDRAAASGAQGPLLPPSARAIVSASAEPAPLAPPPQGR